MEESLNYHRKWTLIQKTSLNQICQIFCGFQDLDLTSEPFNLQILFFKNTFELRLNKCDTQICIFFHGLLSPLQSAFAASLQQPFAPIASEVSFSIFPDQSLSASLKAALNLYLRAFFLEVGKCLSILFYLCSTALIWASVNFCGIHIQNCRIFDTFYKRDYLQIHISQTFLKGSISCSSIRETSIKLIFLAVNPSLCLQLGQSLLLLVHRVMHSRQKSCVQREHSLGSQSKQRHMEQVKAEVVPSPSSSGANLRFETDCWREWGIGWREERQALTSSSEKVDSILIYQKILFPIVIDISSYPQSVMELYQEKKKQDAFLKRKEDKMKKIEDNFHKFVEKRIIDTAEMRKSRGLRIAPTNTDEYA